MQIGVILPSLRVQREQHLDLATAARHAEAVGLDSVWHGDHLATGTPSLECAIALAIAAAVTNNVGIGAAVLVPAIRPLAWAAKQIASLQHVANGRLIVGIGSGGTAEQWAAAGVPYRERGTRTDAALESLPALLDGQRVRLDEPGQPEITLAPAVPPPPFWVGNASPVAIRRAARLATGWFPSLISPRELAAGAATLAGLAREHHRRPPLAAIGLTGVLGAGPNVPDRRHIATGIGQTYRRPADEVMSIPIMGDPQQTAEQLAAYREAGACHAVMGFADGDWWEQCELLATARTLLD